MEAARKYQKVSTLRKVRCDKGVVRKVAKRRYMSSMCFPFENSKYGAGAITVPINENAIPAIEMICAKFGCSKILSITEKMCGLFCLEHQGNNLRLPNGIFLKR